MSRKTCFESFCTGTIFWRGKTSVFPCRKNVNTTGKVSRGDLLKKGYRGFLYIKTNKRKAKKNDETNFGNDVGDGDVTWYVADMGRGDRINHS